MTTITTSDSPQVPTDRGASSEKGEGNGSEPTLSKVEANPTNSDHDPEAPDNDGGKEPQGALQQIMTRNEQIVTHILYNTPPQLPSTTQKAEQY